MFINCFEFPIYGTVTSAMITDELIFKHGKYPVLSSNDSIYGGIIIQLILKVSNLQSLQNEALLWLGIRYPCQTKIKTLYSRN